MPCFSITIAPNDNYWTFLFRANISIAVRLKILIYDERVSYRQIQRKIIRTLKIYHNKGNNKITELRTILQRESQNS